jgi:uncharacterized protein YidB (DUF937 family)/outer membrane protein OmpA-like peptidoglycan-associated protein
MFDLIIKEAASRFGLGDKAGMLVQMLLAFMTNKDTGGLNGFMDLFKSKGLGDLASSWLGGGSNAKPISNSQIESLFGGSGGLLSALTAKSGLGSGVITSALGYLLPSVLGKLTPGGSIPTSLSSEILGFADQGKNLLGGLLGSGAAAAGAAAAGATRAVGAAADAGKAAGGGLMKWLPWLIAALVALWLLRSCTGGQDAVKQAADTTKAAASATADAAKSTATAAADASKAAVDATKEAASAAADAAKAAAAATTAAASTAVASGAAAVLSYLDSAPAAVAGAPVAKVYFDTGKTDLPADFAALMKPVIDFVKANAGTKAALSGFHDPTGDKAQNEELAKNRAKMVREQLRVAGFGEDQILMVKPASTTGTGDNKEARRVEVTVVK